MMVRLDGSGAVRLMWSVKWTYYAMVPAPLVHGLSHCRGIVTSRSAMSLHLLELAHRLEMAGAIYRVSRR